MSYKKYTKKDFLQIVENDRDLNLKEFEKMKLSELQKFFNFTHKDNKTNKSINVNNFEYILCLCCANHYRPDEASQRDRRYCMDCY